MKTKLLLIDCKTLLVARYDGRTRDPQLAQIEAGPIDESVLKALDQFRLIGAAALQADSQ